MIEIKIRATLRNEGCEEKALLCSHTHTCTGDRCTRTKMKNDTRTGDRGTRAKMENDGDRNKEDTKEHGMS